MYVYLSYLCSLCSWCVSVLFLALVVCVPLLCVCLSFFLYWFLSFLCFLVGSLFLAVVGFFIRRACSCVCCLSVVGVSLVLFPCTGVCLCGGCCMYVPCVCSPLSCVCVLCVLFFICVSVGACGCSFDGGRVWFYWRMCASLMYVPLMSLVFLSCLSFFVLWVFVAQVVCAFWGFVFLGCFLGCLVVVCGGCFLFFGVCRGFCFVGVVVFGVGFCLVDVVVLFVLFLGVCSCG